MAELTHIDEKLGPQMVDVKEKNITKRSARAKGVMFLGEELISFLNNNEGKTKKGPVFDTAKVAATLAVKNTSNIIPFCHPLMIENIKVEINFLDHEFIEIYCLVETTGKTGVEMEAINGVQAAALTIYDMCKSFSFDMKIQDVHLIEKRGGKSDFKQC